MGGVVTAYPLDTLLDAPDNRRATVAARFGPALRASGVLVLLGLWHVPAHRPLIATLGLLLGMYAPLKGTIPKA